MELGKQVKTFDAARDEEIKKLVHTSIVSETIRQFPALGLKSEDLTAVVEKAIDTCTQALTENVIPIPQAVVQPFTEVKHGFYDFKLDTRNMNWHPSDDTLIGTELQEGGETFEYNTGFALFPKTDTVENEIVRHIIVHDNVDYSSCADLIYSLIADAKRHFLSYLNPEETEKVMRDRQRSLAEIIYAQMNEHFYKEETSYRASSMRPFTRIETGFGGKFKSDDLYDLHASLSPSEVKTKIFKGFKKACHTLYKFDSNTERIFAIVLENDGAVLKWMRPSAKQFNIYYGPGGISRYEPDFVVETSDAIYMVETKASDDVQKALQNKSGDVWEKAVAGQEYCRAVTEWNAKNGGKPWKYALISHDEVRLQSSFLYLVKNRVEPEH
jgi:type III restriction enzyme